MPSFAIGGPAGAVIDMMLRNRGSVTQPEAVSAPAPSPAMETTPSASTGTDTGATDPIYTVADIVARILSQRGAASATNPSAPVARWGSWGRL